MKIQLLFILAAITSVSINAANFADVHLSHLSPDESQVIWTRTNQFTPMYPAELAMQGVAGCGVFKLTINTKGELDDVVLVSSVPKKIIFKPAKKVIKSWSWQNVSNLPNASEEKLIRLDFCMGGSSEAEAKQLCEQQSQLKCEE